MSHARVMPSKLHLTVPCPGSLQLQEEAARRAPIPMTRDQAEGELGHLIARKYAQGFAAEWPLGRVTSVGVHEFEVDDDMVEGAHIYKEEAQLGSDARFEEPINVPDIPECFGTPDYWRIIAEVFLRLLKVVDYKYGHRFVEVWQHYQLIAYAAGIARFLNLPLDFPVKLVIVQPRNYTHGAVREWSTTVGEVYRIVAERIRPQVELALGPNPPTVTGRHCLDCAARHICTTLAVETASVVDFAGTAEAQDLSTTHIGQELRILKEAMKRLEARYTGLYQQASSMAAATRIAHWNMERGNGKLRWHEDVPKDHIATLGDLMGVDVRKPMQLVTPTQAIQKGIDKTVIDFYASRPPGAPRLVQDDATRTRKIFGDNK